MKATDSQSQSAFHPLPSSISHRAGEIILVTGPARSGKSGWAESLAERSSYAVTYVATACFREDDPEWSDRIQKHRQRRPSHWQTQEVPEHLTEILESSAAHQCLLIDSLGTWIANTLGQSEAEWQKQTQQFLHSIHQCQALVIVVAEETGWGVVPPYKSGRSFRDRLGQLSQALGSQADAVYLAVAGYALPLHQLGYPLSCITH